MSARECMTCQSGVAVPKTGELCAASSASSRPAQESTEAPCVDLDAALRGADEADARATQGTAGDWYLGDLYGEIRADWYGDGEGMLVAKVEHEDDAGAIVAARAAVHALAAAVRDLVRDLAATRAALAAERAKLARCVEGVFAEMATRDARGLPCGHTVGDLISSPGAVTKCGACLAALARSREDAR